MKKVYQGLSETAVLSEPTIHDSNDHHPQDTVSDSNRAVCRANRVAHSLAEKPMSSPAATLESYRLALDGEGDWPAARLRR